MHPLGFRPQWVQDSRHPPQGHAHTISGTERTVATILVLGRVAQTNAGTACKPFAIDVKSLPPRIAHWAAHPPPMTAKVQRCRGKEHGPLFQPAHHDAEIRALYAEMSRPVLHQASVGMREAHHG